MTEVKVFGRAVENAAWRGTIIFVLYVVCAVTLPITIPGHYVLRLCGREGFFRYDWMDESVCVNLSTSAFGPRK